jgi:beta-1,2-mannobiose phosphorylase / 1,2-beta-oligomannan phosphorylase
MSEFEVRRLGVVMEPEAGNAMEAEGVLNPGAVRARDGQLYLFPRLVARGNYSRIGIARVVFDAAGDPRGVERLGIALEPEADYELRANGGGCEDPRVTFVEPLHHYVMTYTALSRHGPRIAIAISEDLFHWRRLGLATFRPYRGIAFDGIDNKDASVFPVPIPDPSGLPAMGLIHRPLFPETRPEETAGHLPSRPVNLRRESIWISYCRLDGKNDPNHLSEFTSHRRLASPVEPWEHLKIGAGTPPIRTRHGWLVVYHGVHKITEPGADNGKLRYSAGVMVLSEKQPHLLRYRAAEAVLAPAPADGHRGTVDNVVFPTAIDRRDDLGMPDRLDIYYGMADSRVGAVRLIVPENLTTRAIADRPRHSAPSSHAGT